MAFSIAGPSRPPPSNGAPSTFKSQTLDAQKQELDQRQEALNDSEWELQQRAEGLDEYEGDVLSREQQVTSRERRLARIVANWTGAPVPTAQGIGEFLKNFDWTALPVPARFYGGGMGMQMGHLENQAQTHEYNFNAPRGLLPPVEESTLNDEVDLSARPDAGFDLSSELDEHITGSTHRVFDWNKDKAALPGVVPSIEKDEPSAHQASSSSSRTDLAIPDAQSRLRTHVKKRKREFSTDADQETGQSTRKGRGKKPKVVIDLTGDDD